MLGELTWRSCVNPSEEGRQKLHAVVGISLTSTALLHGGVQHIHAHTQVGSVIRNPEVQNLVPALLGAIERPNDRTRECLDTLLDTVFVNTVDAASLALIVPVLNRALRERTTEIKKKVRIEFLVAE